MTDDRNESWRRGSDGFNGERGDSESSPPDRQDASPQYSRRLNWQDKKVDRSLAELDNVIAELNKATSQWAGGGASQATKPPLFASPQVVEAETAAVPVLTIPVEPQPQKAPQEPKKVTEPPKVAEPEPDRSPRRRLNRK